MGKHAYLIIAHNQYEMLNKLVLALDHRLNDFYIHIDKKTKELPCISSIYSNINLLTVRKKNILGTL